ncbi:MAG: hypothetical protein C4547_04865, partial [Phycisphaerales bacterium]
WMDWMDWMDRRDWIDGIEAVGALEGRGAGDEATALAGLTGRAAGREARPVRADGRALSDTRDRAANLGCGLASTVCFEPGLGYNR